MLAILFTACQRTDFDDIRRRQEKMGDDFAAMQRSIQAMNSNITGLQSIVSALQDAKTIKSYTATPTGYLLVMSDGSTITLTNGKDGTNAPVVGTKLDADGEYYWTLDGAYIIQGSQKLPVTGKDGANGTNGTNGVTPKMRVNSANMWEISYDNGSTWALVLDASSNPIIATGPKGDAGAPGAPGATGPAGPQGPAGTDGTSNLSITDNGAAVIITLNGTSYTIPKSGGTTTTEDYRVAFETTFAAGSNISLSLNSALSDWTGVWIDYNNNDKRDAGEEVTERNSLFIVTVPASKIITVHGKITGITCRFGSIKAIDISNNPGLRAFDFSNNEIQSVDLSNNPALERLTLSNNKLTTLDVSKNIKLQNLYCDGNDLFGISGVANTDLITINCFKNQFNQAGMEKLLSELQDLRSWSSGGGNLYFHSSDAAERNVKPSTTQIDDALTNKNWRVYVDF